MCRDYLAQLERHHNEIRKAGLKVLAVGIGEPKHARAVAGRIAPTIECLSDKTGGIHQAYGVNRGALSHIVDPRLIKAAGRALSHGQVQSRATGDISILGGTFIIDQPGLVRYAHYDQVAGDAPHIPTLLRQYQSDSKS